MLFIHSLLYRLDALDRFPLRAKEGFYATKRQSEDLINVLPGEWCALGGSLKLYEFALVCQHDVEVHLGTEVLLIA